MKPTEPTVIGFAYMNPQLVIRTDNLRMTGYRHLRQLTGTTGEFREEDRYKAVANTFEIISAPWIKPGGQITPLEKKILTRLKNYSIITLPRGSYTLEVL
jgi:hypothetical protein